MKLAWPESQNRVSLKCGSMDSVLISSDGEGGSASGVPLSRGWDGGAVCWAQTGMAPRMRANSVARPISRMELPILIRRLMLQISPDRVPPVRNQLNLVFPRRTLNHTILTILYDTR